MGRGGAQRLAIQKGSIDQACKIKRVCACSLYPQTRPTRWRGFWWSGGGSGLPLGCGYVGLQMIFVLVMRLPFGEARRGIGKSGRKAISNISLDKVPSSSSSSSSAVASGGGTAEPVGTMCSQADPQLGHRKPLERNMKWWWQLWKRVGSLGDMRN